MNDVETCVVFGLAIVGVGLCLAAIVDHFCKSDDPAEWDE
jgi:hypothetical protein